MDEEDKELADTLQKMSQEPGSYEIIIIRYRTIETNLYLALKEIKRLLKPRKRSNNRKKAARSVNCKKKKRSKRRETKGK